MNKAFEKFQTIESLDNLNPHENWLFDKVRHNGKGIFKSKFVIKLLMTISIERAKLTRQEAVVHEAGEACGRALSIGGSYGHLQKLHNELETLSKLEDA